MMVFIGVSNGAFPRLASGDELLSFAAGLLLTYSRRFRALGRRAGFLP
jgi:hypothetical protein